MSLKSLLTGWIIPGITKDIKIRRFSTTGDILSYKRCRKQYGYFGVRGFASATATQMYFGTLIHDVMDRINRNYQLYGLLPSLSEIEIMVEEGHELLFRSGIKAYNIKAQKDLAVKQIDRFVQMIGPCFFPHVTQTEYRLERTLQTKTGLDYVLTGVVDVLAGAVSHSLGLPIKTSPNDVEIWDYKSGRAPEKNSEVMQDYNYQLHVYAELYCQQTGTYPSRCALVFMGELGDDKIWKKRGRKVTDFSDLIYHITPHTKNIKDAMQDFQQTVENIENERVKPYEKQWQTPKHSVDDQTCDACDLRYGCSKFTNGKKLRADPL